MDLPGKRMGTKSSKYLKSTKSLYGFNQPKNYIGTLRGDLSINPATLVPALSNQYKILPEPGLIPALYVNPNYVESGYVLETQIS